MKTLIAAVAVLCLTCSAAEAARLQFNGMLQITTVTAACTTAEETEVGALYKWRFNPPDAAMSDPRMGFSIFENNSFGAQNYLIDSGFVVGNTFQPAKRTAVYRMGGSFSGAKFRITKTVPASFDTNTPSITVNGGIQNFDGVTGCTVTFIGVGVQAH